MSTQDRRIAARMTVYCAHVSGTQEIWQAEYEAVADALHLECRDLREGRRTPLSIMENGVCIRQRRFSGLSSGCLQCTRRTVVEHMPSKSAPFHGNHL